MFAYDKNLTLVSYILMERKNVLLISSLHYDDNTDTAMGNADKIIDYNAS